MIGRIEGVIVYKQAPDLLVDVQGVGYEIQLPMSCFFELPAVGQTVALWTHFVVREDAQLLFGFNTLNERALFRQLIKAQGVGPKMALAIMSGMSAGQFVASVQQGDVSTLVKIPGVGKKTAERLVIEMRDRLKDFGANAGFDPSSSDPEPALMVSVENPLDDALSALLALGYKPAQAEKAVKQVAKADMDSEAIIRQALKSMV
ncbi:Holliday junction branch migration protein RuvA [Aliidiomarina maris]|uniref:Holliday junction branch migration complex subunit RuvA n=1 Tax=Aliidiomarina maris TaxID=531312 RepID=A0A327X3K9_9GAMM|nr:Holliday junction branch migration protein RuvA [Aliidiomarina maris]RAK00792.1 Holliday junction DNA helicase subunit RuvA [Aliidiomarina maris]RUO27214.1 Holliday junction branch migration protein RuvA [Aliidiomarina maris]